MSDDSWPGKIRLITDLERPDHSYLEETDSCAYLGSYTAGGGYKHSRTNDLVSNLKKSPAVRKTIQWQYKEQAIRTIARTIGANISSDWDNMTFVPVPPSELRDTELYDDRMARVAKLLHEHADVREVIYAHTKREAMHASSNKRDPAALKATLAVDPDLVANPRPTVILLDDVLTTGCSFKVCQALIREIWPSCSVHGLFVARRVPVKIDWFDDVDEDYSDLV